MRLLCTRIFSVRPRLLFLPPLFHQRRLIMKSSCPCALEPVFTHLTTILVELFIFMNFVTFDKRTVLLLTLLLHSYTLNDSQFFHCPSLYKLDFNRNFLSGALFSCSTDFRKISSSTLSRKTFFMHRLALRV